MKKEKEYIQALFTKPTETFSEHLELPENERIIFSGRFGIGKSTFLNHYFEKEKDQYNVIHLYPVNYSVLQNEDIFTYLKYDILFDLIINKNVVLKSSKDYGITNALPFFVKYKWYSIISLIPLISDKLGGRSLNELMKGVKTLNDEYEEFAKGPKEAAEFSNPFFQLIHQSEGGLYESNKITEIIKGELQNIKGDKENILIIDDLDRIDPAHIFRILNVFSAHFDDRNEDTKNKFGFDKVILVCDIDNIRNIYGAIYGANTDFNGYVDKFYSKEIYRYDNKENLNSILKNISNKIILKSGLINEMEIELNKTIFNSSYILKLFLTECINDNLINLRNLLKFYKKDIILDNIFLSSKGSDFRKNQTLIALTILMKLLGDINIFKFVLGRLEFKKIEFVKDFENDYLRDHIGEMIKLVYAKEISELSNGKHTIKAIERNFEIKVSGDHHSSKIYYDGKEMLDPLDYKRLLLDLIEIL